MQTHHFFCVYPVLDVVHTKSDNGITNYAGRRKRKPSNWNADETLALTNLVDENKHTIRGKLGLNLTSNLKNRTWQKIVETLCVG